jgi:predicted membrane protein
MGFPRLYSLLFSPFFAFLLSVFSFWFSLLFVGCFSACNGLLAVLSPFMNGLLQKKKKKKKKKREEEERITLRKSLQFFFNGVIQYGQPIYLLQFFLD